MRKMWFAVVALFVIRALVLALFLAVLLVPILSCRKCDGTSDDALELCKALGTHAPHSGLFMLDALLQGAYVRGTILPDNPQLVFGIMSHDTKGLRSRVAGVANLTLSWDFPHANGKLCYTATSGRRVSAKVVVFTHSGHVVKPVSPFVTRRSAPVTTYLPLQTMRLGDVTLQAPHDPRTVLLKRYRGDFGVWGFKVDDIETPPPPIDNINVT